MRTYAQRFPRDLWRIYRKAHSAARRRDLLRCWCAIRLAPASAAPAANLGRLRLFAGSHNDLAFGFMEMFVHEEYRVPVSAEAPAIIDCGANVGLATLYFKTRFPRARITSYEPNPASVALIERHVRENQLTGVTIRPVACGLNPGPARFYVNATDSIISSLDPTRAQAQQGLDVTVVRLSDEIHGPVDLLKLDVEGAESDVLEDLTRTGKLALVRAMIVEYHHQIGGRAPAFGAFLQRLEAAGFRYELESRTSSASRFRGAFQDVMIYASRP